MAKRTVRATVAVLGLGLLLPADRSAPVLQSEADRLGNSQARLDSTGRQRASSAVASAVARARRLPRFVLPPSLPSFPGLPVHTPNAPELLHGVEARDPVWAPAMEAAIARTFLSPAVFSRLGLQDMKVTGVSCHQTTCQVVYEFPDRLIDLVAASGLPAGPPMILVEEAMGWSAPRGGGLQKRRFERDGQPHTSISLVLGFDEASWDPATYDRWLTSQQPSTQAFYRRAREKHARKTGAATPIDVPTYRDAG